MFLCLDFKLKKLRSTALGETVTSICILGSWCTHVHIWGEYRVVMGRAVQEYRDTKLNLRSF